tara:strand:- start:25 stop:1572 length:1548 start_codon:yes stop_codon:yes gene_type:complete
MNNPVDSDSKDGINLIHWGAMLCWILLIFGLGNKPVHLDEANFLAMTQGEFWRPHLIQINWEGVEQSAFDVLSNPPGMVWFLWPVKDLSVIWMRVWVLPWSFLALWGLWKCIEHIGGSQHKIWLMLCSPIFVLSHNSLMPEMPLFACIVMGWQGIFRGQNRTLWALILGTSAIFRYSGLTMIPLLTAWVVLNKPSKGWRLIVAVSLPTILLCIHDVWAYGEWHFLHMIAFQQEQQSWTSFVHKLCALSSMLVLGCGVVPRLRRDHRWAWPLLTACILLTVTLSYGFALDMSLLAWLSVPLGFFVVARFVQEAIDAKRFWVVCWLMGGLFFLLSLRFAATRYWLPFVGPYWLWMHEDKWLKYWTLIMAIVSIHLAWDDAQLAKSQHHLARKVVQICKEQYGDETGYFAGHWGWQYALEEVGWSSVENDSTIPNNVCFSYSEASWPQEIDNICFEDVVRFEFDYDHFGLPIRVHTAEGQANYHSYMISNRPPLSTMTPFGWGTDDWDQVELRRSCLR